MKVREILGNDKGEMLIEMIISIAIFSLMVGMITMSYSVSQNIILNNNDTRNEMNTRVIFINEASLSDATSHGLNVSGQKTISWSIEGGDNGSFTIKTISDGESAFEKYVIYNP